VDSGGLVGDYSSVAIDANDLARISYYDETNRNLMYAWWDGADWIYETVDSTNDVGQYCSLALDALTGAIHISYFDATTKDLKYAQADNPGAVPEPSTLLLLGIGLAGLIRKRCNRKTK
jgi:hypothetical protein